MLHSCFSKFKPLPCGTNGSFQNDYKFKCEQGKAMFVPLSFCQPVEQFEGKISFWFVVFKFLFG